MRVGEDTGAPAFAFAFAFALGTAGAGAVAFAAPRAGRARGGVLERAATRRDGVAPRARDLAEVPLPGSALAVVGFTDAMGSSHEEYSEVGQGIASIARSKAVYSAIDSHALGGLKTRMVFANSTARKTEV
jgi:hypothetical protein